MENIDFEVSELLKKCGFNRPVNSYFDYDNEQPMEVTSSVKKDWNKDPYLYSRPTLEEIMKEYFERVHSTNWDYVTVVDEEVIVYNMNAEEFKEFVEEFGRVNSRKVVRLIKESGRMIRWFEERIT
jgi:thiol-disulfide isomerase/thioredoxin